MGRQQEVEMSTIAHEPSAVTRRPYWIDARNVWATLSIVSIWAAVVLTMILGPDLEVISSGGSDRVTMPSGIFVAFFALLATYPVAKYGFDRKQQVD
jgi:hypothetical protein